MQFSFSRSDKIFILIIAMSFMLNCACFNKNNRWLLNTMDNGIKPKSTGLKIALAPIAIPIATVTLTLDVVLIHPIRVIPKVADDVYQLYWKPRDIDWLRKSLLFIPIVVLTPPTFVGDWMIRSIFDIKD